MPAERIDVESGGLGDSMDIVRGFGLMTDGRRVSGYSSSKRLIMRSNV